MVEEALRKAFPAIGGGDQAVIRTSGDERKHDLPMIDRKAGRKECLPVRSRKNWWRGGSICAVHSAKDLPSEQPNDLEVRATLPRANQLKTF